jgi:antitoxin HicB
MYRVPLVFSPQPEGGYTVTSPELPELLTEGDTLAEAQANVGDAFEAVVELYADQGRSLPASICLPAPGEVVWSETLVGTP